MELGLQYKSQILPSPQIGEIWQYAIHQTFFKLHKKESPKEHEDKWYRLPYNHRTGQYQVFKVETQEDIQMIKEGFDTHCFRKIRSA